MQNIDDETRASYLPDLNDYQKDDFDEDDRGPEEEIYGWDPFKYFPPKLKTGSNADTGFFDGAAQVAKFLTYCVLFVLTLGGGILAKGTIIFATSQINNHDNVPYCDYNDMAGRPSGRNMTSVVPKESRVAWYWCILMAFTLPEFMGLLIAVYHWFFKKQKAARPSDIIFLLLIEGFHAIGLSSLFFLVLPELNSVQAVIISSCTCLVPGILGLLSRCQRRRTGNTFITFTGDIVAIVAQLCGILIWLYPDERVKMTLQSRCVLPIALLLTSSRWWSNYVSSRSSFGCIRFLYGIRDRLQASASVNEGFSAIGRILVFFGFFIVITYSKGIELASLFDGATIAGKFNVSLVDSSPSDMSNPLLESIPSAKTRAGYLTIDSYYLPLVVLVVHSVSAFFTYSSGKFAYRTLMQGYGFALPVTLIVPGTVGTVILLSALRHSDTCIFHKVFPDYLFFNVPENIGHLSDFLSHWYPWIWLITLASQGWITMHIWSPNTERLAATGRIFVVPTYDSLIIDQSIVLNRRIDEIPADEPIMEKVEAVNEALTEMTYSNRSSNSGLTDFERNDRVTRIIACATMWHETADEMTEFLGSILRLDTDQGSKRFTQGYYNLKMQEYYELETHVFFDDAFRCMHGCEGPCKHDENETQVNDYVMCLIDTMRKSVERLHLLATPPLKYPAPYGGRLEWTLPGKTCLVVHLKDKNKIRHRKRWSQVMYMYYLLGYRLMDQPMSQERKEIIAENTYLLTLDGDIDFRPSAVKVLIDLMKRDKDLGAACGRIHPMGTGPMVWFQKFEYAIGHWLQKSTEHTIGSVLCSPGCFSLFRAKALMEHNVMRKYAIQSTEPRHYVQYDQGEDRWLCTLVLQVGYRVEYSAASDSYTHAPETFSEFYNQRRRWIPSTIANIFDLLSTSEETRKANDDISLLYIVYQWVLMGSTVIGPGTIFLMLVGAFVAAFRIDNWSSFGYNLIPIIIFVVVCFTCKANVQLIVAGIITAFYGLVMIVVLVGVMIQIAEDGWTAPSTILFFVVAAQLVVAGLLHPQEVSCLLCGLVYYVTVPSMYMLLIIFSVFNVNNVTWGTRDSKAAIVPENDVEGDRSRNDKSTGKSKIGSLRVKDKTSSDFSLAELFRCVLCMRNDKSQTEQKLDVISESLDRITSRLDAMEKNANGYESQKNRQNESTTSRSNDYDGVRSNDTRMKQNDSEKYTDDYDDLDDDDDVDILENDEDIYVPGSTRESENFLVCPYWLQDERLRKGGVEFLSRDEEFFWQTLIEKYLHPIEEDKKQMAKTAEGLKNLRDEYLFKFFMLNALFVLIVFLMQLNKDILHLEWPLGETYNITYIDVAKEVHLAKNYLKLEPIGCLFIVGFVVILGVQFIAMLFHRYDTFAHILANTSLEWPCCRKPVILTDEQSLEKHADDIADGFQRVVENHAGSVLARRSSTVAPGKRKTVHELVDSHMRRTKLPSSIDTLFRRNLNDSNSGVSRLMSTKVPRTVFEAFERRRSTIVAADRRQSRLFQRPSTDNAHDKSQSSSERYPDSIPSANGYSYDNRAFIGEDYNEELDNGNDDVTVYQRPNHVTFDKVNA